MKGSPTPADRSAPSDAWIRRHCAPLLVAIVALGFLLRLYRIGNEGLWIDEAFSIWLVRRPFGEMIRWVQEVDHHPPLYYGLLYVWRAIVGLDEGRARALSALFGALTIPVVYSLGRRVADQKVGVATALILALSPFHVRLAQEARMYTLLTFEASLALYAFVRLYGDWSGSDAHALGPLPGGRCSIARSMGAPLSLLPGLGYVVFTAAMLWTHNTALFFPLTANLLVLGTVLGRRPPLGARPAQGVARRSACGGSSSRWLQGWFAAQVAVFLLWLPWLPSFLSQAADVWRRFWLPAPTLGSVLGVVGLFLCEAPSWPVLLVVPPITGLAALTLVGLWAFRRRSHYTALLGVMVLVPFAAQWLVSLWRPILYARTLIWASIPLYVMVAAGVAWLEVGGLSKTAARRLNLAILVALVAVYGSALSSYYVTAEKESWDEAAALVAQRVQADDLLLFNDAWGQIPFDYYFGRLYNPQPVSSSGPSSERSRPTRRSRT